ncbi:MAG: hypothetical protein RRY12_07645 [Cloacibacillus sp.]
MRFAFLFESMPLPFLTLLFPFIGAMLCSGLLLYNRFLSRRFGHALVLPKVVYKLPFLALLVLDVIFSYIIWSRVTGPSAPIYVLTARGWTTALSGEAAANLLTVFRIDPFSAVSAALMNFVALTAGICALADKKNIITPRKTAFFLFTCTGIQGIFYSNGLYLLTLFMALTQFGVTGLYSNFETKKKPGGESVYYYISRVTMLVMFFAGVLTLKFEYGTDNINVLASRIVSSGPSLAAFILLAAPMLYLFIKPSPYLPDASRNCFFGIRTQASLFVVFRIIFSIYGPMDGLQKVPYLFIMLGFALILLAVFLSCAVKDPAAFMNSVVMYMKGMVLAAIGIAMHGVFGAERAALYGVSALEGMILLWLVFLPITAALAVITVYLKQEGGGVEMWRGGALLDRAPMVAVTLFLLAAMVSGLPPFIGYSGKQLLFRSANFINPLVFVFLFIFTVLMLLTSLRFLVSLMTGGRSPGSEFVFSGEATIALPLILLLTLFVGATMLPGALYEESVAPSVEALINRTAPDSSGAAEASVK